MRCVLLFARSPFREGALKGLPEATEFFATARKRLAEEVRGLPGVDLILAGEGPIPEGGVLAQRGATFGERLLNALSDTEARGYTEILVVAGDVPGLSARTLSEAFEALALGRVVLGPSPDGGAYLLGLSAGDVAARAVLGLVRWQTAHVALDLVRLLHAERRAVALLGALTDIDRRADLGLALGDVLDPALRALLRGLLAAPGGARARRMRRAARSSARPSAPARAPPRSVTV